MYFCLLCVWLYGITVLGTPASTHRRFLCSHLHLRTLPHTKSVGITEEYMLKINICFCYIYTPSLCLLSCTMLTNIPTATAVIHATSPYQAVWYVVEISECAPKRTQKCHSKPGIRTALEAGKRHDRTTEDICCSWLYPNTILNTAVITRIDGGCAVYFIRNRRSRTNENYSLDHCTHLPQVL